MLAAVLLAIGGGGCDDDRSSPFVELATDPSFPGTPGDPQQHAALFDFAAVPSCAVSNPTNLAASTPLRIFRGPGVSDGDLNAFLGGLQRYYRQYGVTMTTAFDVINLPMREAMILNIPALTSRVRERTGIDIRRSDLTPAEQVQSEEAIGAAMMNNIKELLRVYGMPRRPEINVVVLPAMALNISKELMEFQGILGLGVSPELLASFPANDPGQQLYQWLEIQGEFTPTAIVGVAPIKRYLSYPDIAIAHELGHAYGLAHVLTGGNLLHQGEVSCGLELDPTQLQRVGQAAAGSADVVGLEAGSLTNRVGDLMLAIHQLVRSDLRGAN